MKHSLLPVLLIFFFGHQGLAQRELNETNVKFLLIGKWVRTDFPLATDTTIYFLDGSYQTKTIGDISTGIWKVVKFKKKYTIEYSNVKREYFDGEPACINLFKEEMYITKINSDEMIWVFRYKEKKKSRWKKDLIKYKKLVN